MIKLNNILNEEIPFDKAQSVKAGLSKKYGSEELDAYTFGIEFEFMPSSTDEVDVDKLRMELEKNREVRDNYDEWLEEKRSDSNRRLRGLDDWDNTYGPMSVDTFDELVSEPDRSDYDDEDAYKEAHEKWDEQRDDVGHEYNYWEKRDKHEKWDEYINELIENGDWERYVDRENVPDNSSMDDDIIETMNYINNVMQQKVKSDSSSKDIWGVGPDGDNIEIRSKHLNQNEFGLVKQMCDYVKTKNVSGKTSGHVHIGLPNDFDAFDLLAITTLVDEKAIKSTVGPGRDLSSWAQLRNKLHNTIVNALIKTPENQSTKEKSFVLSNEKLKNLLSSIGRYWGTNPASMMKTHTIEFRYLSSESARNPDHFIKWIQYYLLLPKVAKSRNSIVLKQTIGTDSQTVTAIRQSGSVKFVLNTGKYSTPNLPAADLKAGQVGVVSPKVKQAMQKKLSSIQI